MKPCSKCLIKFDDLNTFCVQCSGSLFDYSDVQHYESSPDHSIKVCPSCQAINESAYFCCRSCGQILFTEKEAVGGQQPETGSAGDISSTESVLYADTTWEGDVPALEISDDNFLESHFLDKYDIYAPIIQTANQNLKETTPSTLTEECESQAGDVEPPAGKYSLIIGVSYLVGLVFMIIFMQISLGKKSHMIQTGANTLTSKETHRAEVSSDLPPTPPLENRQQDQDESRIFATENLVEGGHSVEGDVKSAETERQDLSVREENLLPAPLSDPPASGKEIDSEEITITPGPASGESQPVNTHNRQKDISARDSLDITHSSSDKSESSLQLLTDNPGVSDKPENKRLHLAKEQSKIPVRCRSLYKKLSVGKVLNSQEAYFLFHHCN